jgi:hypothetical protein
VSGRVSRLLFSASLMALLAGCSSLGFGGDKQPATQVTVQPQADDGSAASPVGAQAAAEPVIPAAPGPAYVAGKCPQVVVRDEGAVHRVYKGAKTDPQQLSYQASLVQATRQCTTNGTSLNITVVAQGRVVSGPAGMPSAVNLPIKVEVLDGENVLYTDTTSFAVTMPGGESTTQFLYTDNKVTTTGGSGGFTQVVVSFNEGGAGKAKPVGKKKK